MKDEVRHTGYTKEQVDGKVIKHVVEAKIQSKIEVIKKLLDEYADIKPVLTKVGYKSKAEIIAHKIDALYQPDEQIRFISKYLAQRFIGEEAAEDECDSEAEFIVRYFEQREANHEG